MSTIHELEQRIKVLETLLGRGVEHLEVDEDGYLKITDMYFNTPNEAGYILDQYGNFIHSKNDSYDSWNIMSYNGTPKFAVSFEGNVFNKIGAGLECTDSVINTKQSNNGITAVRGSTYLNIRDTNGLIMSTIRNETNPNGAIKAQLQARNYNSSGRLVKIGSIEINVAKDGTLSYGVTEPNKFRQAIGVLKPVITQRVTKTIDRAYAKSVAITAPTVANYKFVAWVAVETTGWVGSCYITSAVASNAAIWNASTGQSGNGTVVATALYCLDI